MWLLTLVTTTLLVGGSSGQDCGRTNDLRPLTDRQGDVLTVGQYPAMCQIFTPYEGNNVFLGGATLIQKNQLVTLASLINILGLTASGGGVGGGEGGNDLPFTSFINLRENEEEEVVEDCQAYQPPTREIRVICGSLNLQGDDKDDLSQRSKVTRIVLHPDYSPTNLTNDFAVLLVDPPFNYTDTVSQVCLPKPGEKRKAGEKCVAMGHGKDNNGTNGIYSPQLAEITLPIMSSEVCEATLNSLHFEGKLPQSWKIHESFLCAGGEEAKDTCEGDGGGPLLCKVAVGAEEEQFSATDLDLRADQEEETRLVQAGITAWGIGCGQGGFPGVYSDMESASCWLDQIMTCYPEKGDEEEDNLVPTNFLGKVGLRQNNQRPPSVRQFTDSMCKTWVDSGAADLAACGCRLRYLPDQQEEALANSFGLRGAAEDYPEDYYNDN